MCVYFYLVEVFDDASGEVPLVFDGRLYQLVEVIGTDLKCLNHPWKGSAKKNKPILPIV